MFPPLVKTTTVCSCLVLQIINHTYVLVSEHHHIRLRRYGIPVEQHTGAELGLQSSNSTYRNSQSYKSVVISSLSTLRLSGLGRVTEMPLSTTVPQSVNTNWSESHEKTPTEGQMTMFQLKYQNCHSSTLLLSVSNYLCNRNCFLNPLPLAAITGMLHL